MNRSRRTGNAAAAVAIAAAVALITSLNMPSSRAGVLVIEPSGCSAAEVMLYREAQGNVTPQSGDLLETFPQPPANIRLSLPAGGYFVVYACTSPQRNVEDGTGVRQGRTTVDFPLISYPR